MKPFVRFGSDHCLTLVVLALAGWGLVRLSQAGTRTAAVVRAGLALSMVSLAAAEILQAVREGWFSWRVFLPLHLCDAALILAVIGLLTRSRTVSELLYFWACSASILALVTPDLAYGLPHWEFLLFFALHGLVVISALVLTLGSGLAPRPGAARRAFVVTNLYAAAVGGVNVLCRTNFLYLCAKPAAPTLLDFLGPWPVYLLVADAIAWVLFQLLALPWRQRASG